LPTDFPTTNPTCAPPVPGDGTINEATSVPAPQRRPSRATEANSARVRMRAGRGSTERAARASGGELAATLAPASSEDRAPRAGPHPEPEAVRLRAPAVVRLKGALAHCVDSVAGVRGLSGRARARKADGPANAARGRATRRDASTVRAARGRVKRAVGHAPRAHDPRHRRASPGALCTRLRRLWTSG
jgi:hypothetical protein